MDSVQQIYVTNQTPLSQTFRATLHFGIIDKIGLIIVPTASILDALYWQTYRQVG